MIFTEFSESWPNPKMVWFPGRIPICKLYVTSGGNKNHIPSPALVRYLLLFTPVNSYLTRWSLEILIFATTSGDTSVRCGVTLVTIQLLDLLIFHWIQQIQWKSLREIQIVHIHSAQNKGTHYINSISQRWNQIMKEMAAPSGLLIAL